MIKQEYSSIYKSVAKPGRYAGGEYGQIIKDPKNVKARFAFCFPDTYEIGMSNLGIRILYGALNKEKDIWCERAYDPWTDMQEKMRKYKMPLTAMESGDPLKVFDFVGFTLQYEMSYTNVLNMLQLADIPIRMENRGENDPIIIGGGPCAYNPEPVADFFDLFDIGEGEELLPEIVKLYIKMKDEGRYTRNEFLHEAARTIEGVYVPSFYDVTYHEDGTIKAYTPIYDDIPTKIKKRIVKDLDKSYFPDKFVLPYVETVHDRITLEVYRGCIRGCRFCQAGMIYRPVREKTPEVLNRQAKQLYKSTGYEEISLSSLSISDYTKIEPLCDQLLSWTDDRKVSLSLPSLRVDNFSQKLMSRVESVRSASLTFAPEAGTQRLRNVINKNVSEDDVFRTVNVAFDSGKTNIKLYFMNGLPTETKEDIEGIAKLAESVVEAFYKNPNHSKRPPQVTISVACFVPKPFTPFQWEPQDSMQMLEEKQEYLKSCITNRHVRYQHHDAKTSMIEAVLARGSRKLCRVMELALEEGFCFDAWDEYFDYDRWMSLFSKANIDPSFFSNRKYSFDEVLPWDIIDCGVTKEFLKKECEKAYQATTTKNCREQCNGCGANKLGGERSVCTKECNSCDSGEIDDVEIFNPEIYPKLENFKTVRIMFRKVGNLQYISHLDLQRTIDRVLVRSHIPMWYTQGFNPHAKVTFALPLSIGTQSECEFIDLRLDRDIPCEKVKELLNNELTEEMKILECYEPDTKFSDIGWVKYSLQLHDSKAKSSYYNIMELFQQNSLMTEKKTKSGDMKKIDMKPMLKDINVTLENEDNIIIEGLFAAGIDSSLNPELVVQFIKGNVDIMNEDDMSYDYTIQRIEVYEKDGIKVFR